MVAKFHEKCKQATDVLERLKVAPETRQAPAAFAVEILDGNSLKTEQNTMDETGESCITSGDETERTKVSYIKDEATEEEDYEYVIIEGNDTLHREEVSSVDASSAARIAAASADAGNMEEDMFVVAEYLNSDSEELIDAKGQSMSVDDAGEASDSEAHIHTHQIKPKRLDMGSPKTAAKINIRHCCKICGAGFAQLDNLTRHLATHTNTAPDDIVACDMCNQTFEE